MTSNLPIIYFDIESACRGKRPDAAMDKIVDLCAIKVWDDVVVKKLVIRCNPGVEMSPENVEIHGITNEMVDGLPTFDAFAPDVFKFFHMDQPRHVAYAGFGINNYDNLLLYEEMARCDLEWNLDGALFIDGSVIFKKNEERTLTAAMKFYCGKSHEDAHGAEADTMASAEVLNAQIARYPELAAMSIEELAAYSKHNENVDLAGKIILIDGVPCYNIGKAKDVPVSEDPGFGEWMMHPDRNFSMQTKSVLRQLLDQHYKSITSKSKQGKLF